MKISLLIMDISLYNIQKSIKVLLHKCFHVHLQLALCFYQGTNYFYRLVAKV